MKNHIESYTIIYIPRFTPKRNKPLTGSTRACPDVGTWTPENMKVRCSAEEGLPKSKQLFGVVFLPTDGKTLQ